MKQKKTFVVNDYAGHPFQVELSRELAEMGFDTTHVYCSTNSTPQGDLENTPTGLSIVPTPTGSGFDKYNARRRLVAELIYGVRSAKLLFKHRPEACLNANVPILSLAIITVAARVFGVRNVLWLQDFQAGLAAMVLGDENHPIVKCLSAAERWCVRSADHVVSISDGFEREVVRLGVAEANVTTISNWAPIDDVPVKSRNNHWRNSQGLGEDPVVLYSGTMGIKHRPEALVALAEELKSTGASAKIVVVSEGVGRDWLEAESETRGLDNFVFLPFQPFADLPDVLGAADVLVVLLEPDAGEFSVPSKVLTYLCAERPIVGLMPLTNAASRLVRSEACAGLVADNEQDFVAHSMKLLGDTSLRGQYASSARIYAEREFDRTMIARSFLRILQDEISNEEQNFAEAKV